MSLIKQKWVDYSPITLTDDGNSSYGTAVCLTLSGTTITASSEVVFNAGRTYYNSIVMMDSTHAIVCYQDGGNSGYGTANCIYIT